MDTTLVELQMQFEHNHSDGLGRLSEINRKCQWAWEALEDHLVLQRRFALACRKRARPGDLRALLLACMADPEEAAAPKNGQLVRELAAVVSSAAGQRREPRPEPRPHAGKKVQSPLQHAERKRRRTGGAPDASLQAAGATSAPPAPAPPPAEMGAGAL